MIVRVSGLSGSMLPVALDRGDDQSGLQVLPVQCDPAGVGFDGGGLSTRILRIIPNPSSTRTVIRFAAQIPGPVQASVYGPAGRLVRRLSTVIPGGGAHDLSWDGCDADGHAVAAGVYLVRASTPEGATTGRCVIVR